MALINCPECKKEVSNSASTCPHCGFSLILKEEKPKKKKKGCFTWILVIIAIVLALFYFYSKNNSSTSSSSYSEETVNVSVENVRIAKDFPTVWGVKGSIRNNTPRSIKGAVKIKFINIKGDVVHNNRAYVNDGDLFNSGQSANFEYFTTKNTFTDVVDFKVEFYEN